MKKKRRYRQAAVLLLAAVLILSTGTGSPVFAESEETEPVTGQEQVTEKEPVTESESPTETETITGGETSGESELITEPVTEAETKELETEAEPVTEPESPAEAETVTGGDTSGESELPTESVTEPETETQKTPQAQTAPPVQNQILTVTETDETVQNVQKLIEDLPTVSEVGTMSQEEQQKIYIQAQEAWGTYAALTAEQQAQVDAAKLTKLLDYFNGQAAVLDGTSQKTEDSVAEVVMNDTTTYYDTLNEAVQTVSDSRGTATITLLKDASLTGFNIKSIYGNITFRGGNYTVSGDSLSIVVSGTLTIESGTFDSTGALLAEEGTINISGGMIDSLSRGMGGGNINISGGTVNNLHVMVSHIKPGTVTISGGAVNTITGDGSGLVQYEPDFSVSVQSITAGTITVTPLNNTSTFGNAQYSLDNTNWQDSNVFNTCKAGMQYTVYARYSKAVAVVKSTTARTSDAAYTVTIPATTLTAGESTSTAQISVNTGNKFDLGYDGKITVSSSESVTLARKKDPTTTLTSALFVNGKRHTGGTIITFDIENYQSANATIQFEKPVFSGGTIPAGDYEGNMTFTISYSD